jgi:hypothetical protein
MKALYKENNGQLMMAANAIHFPDETVINVKEHIDKPEGTDVFDGWHVFYSRQAALDFFQIVDPVISNIPASPNPKY